MTPRPLTLAEKAARLHAEKPWLTHSEVMAELAKRRRTKPAYAVLHPMRADRSAFNAVEKPQKFWWNE